MRRLQTGITRWILLFAALLLLWWTLRAVSATEVWQVLRQLQPRELLALVAVNALVLFTLCARWWIFLYAQGHRIPFLRLVGYRLTAFGISYFTPGPHFGGEPWQIYAVSRRHNVPYADSIAAVTLDKLVEMLVNFAFLCAGVLFLLQHPLLLGDGSGAAESATAANGAQELLPQLILYVLLLLCIPLALLFAYRQGYHPVSGLLGRIYKRNPPTPALPAWLQTIGHSEAQISRLCRRQPGLWAAALCISVLSWCAVVWEFWLMSGALNLDLSVTQAILALVAARLAILLPMPAALGVLEAGQAWVMTGLGRGPAAGIGITLFIRARDTLLALVGIWLGGLGLWSLLRGRAQNPAGDMEHVITEADLQTDATRKKPLAPAEENAP